MSMVAESSSINTDSLAKQLWALGDPIRLKILQILPDAPTCATVHNVSMIAERVGLSQPATSHHLRILRQAGIIMNEKRCRDVIYWIDVKAAKEALAEVHSVIGA